MAHVAVDPADFRAFLDDMWIEDVDTLTDHDMACIRKAYAVVTSTSVAA